MQKTQISYAELADKVKDSVLFNNHSEVDEFWYEGMIVSPLMQERLDAESTERRKEEEKSIAESTDESEKAKLTEEYLEHEERGDFDVSIMDLCEGCIYQTYAITPEGARFLFNHTTEIISYSEKLGLYLWHITHWGTSWSGVYTTLYDWDYQETPEWYAYSEDQIDKYINN